MNQTDAYYRALLAYKGAVSEQRDCQRDRRYLADALREQVGTETRLLCTRVRCTVDEAWIHAIEAGLAGMETMYASYSPEKICLAKEIAAEFHLLHSGGSDFHGWVKPDISLGTGKGWLSIPPKVYSDLLAAVHAK